MEVEREDEVRSASLHQLMTVPPHAKCFRNWKLAEDYLVKIEVPAVHVPQPLW